MKTIITGDKNRFALEGAVHTLLGSYLYGDFFIWLGGDRLGDPDDISWMNYVFGWLRDFIDKPSNRIDDYLFCISTQDVDNLIDNENSSEYCYAYGKFDITYIGDTIFDRDKIWIMLIKNTLGQERCLWRTKDQAVEDLILEKGVIEKVISDFLLEFKQILDYFDAH